MERYRLVRGVKIPSFFYGTAWKEERTCALTELALTSGFAAIDTANQRKHYFEAAVGEGLAAVLARSGQTRADFFLQTKFTYARGQDQRLPYDRGASLSTQVAQSCASSLEHLRTTYIDSFLLHGPSHTRGISADDWEVWRAMEALAHAGTVRLLGVSNVSLEQLVALEKGALVKPTFVQNRCYASTGWDREVRAFCNANDIAYQGFSLLTANRRELAHESIKRLMQRSKVPMPTLVFRFALQAGMIPLTGTTSAAHMRDDLSSFDFELGPTDARIIEEIGR